MAARYVSSQLIKNVQKGARSLAVDYVDKTTTWNRPGDFPSADIKEEFADVVEENMHIFKSSTTRVAMKESEHQSDMDKRVHYTAFELDKDGKVIETQHLVKKKNK